EPGCSRAGILHHLRFSEPSGCLWDRGDGLCLARSVGTAAALRDDTYELADRAPLRRHAARFHAVESVPHASDAAQHQRTTGGGGQQVKRRVAGDVFQLRRRREDRDALYVYTSKLWGCSAVGPEYHMSV